MDDHAVPVLPEAEGLMRLTTGLWASQTLAAAEQLGLCTFLSARQGATVAEVATGLDIKERPAEILLTACAALGLLSRDGSRFVNTAMAESYLVRGGQYYLGDYVRMLTEYVYPGWMRVTDAIRADAPARVISKEQQGIFEAGTRPKVFWDGLYPLSALTARALAEAVDFSDARSLLDVGGGTGAFAIELCQRYPELRVTLFDLAFVCEHSAEKVEQLGLAGRIGVHPGDFFADPELPGGHDVILLSMILHDWDEPRNTDLLAKCFQALPSGGRLVISELLVDDEKTGPVNAALMSMNMLVGTWGRNYTVAEYSEWLRKAGFEQLSTVRFTAPGANGAVIAVKP
ncbi:MAG: 3-hydroxy-5-methyl-naphthoate 3-O-methyltransferase [Pseudonocardiales bacterium]|nr:3-hydroxy-5-methyl-naphthoate 3-O-methyltransferase [Pseudonocardiales bacterium]